MPIHNYCDGIQRRDFLKVGVFGATGLTLANYLRLAAAGQANGKSNSAIFINLQGGPSHMDTFDLKPDAPDAFRGEFQPIETNVAGIRISEHLPKLARCADKFAILRGVSHNLADHGLGTKYLVTGNRPIPSLEYPGYGAVAARELPCAEDLPPHVAIPRSAEPTGYLGVEFAAFRTGSMPSLGQPFNVRGIAMQGQTIDILQRRKVLLADLDTVYQDFEDSELVNGLDQFSHRAFDIISSPRAREAFDINKESPSVTEAFAEPLPEGTATRRRGAGGSFGASCLLASRLVEAGVRFVTIRFGGWDTHNENFTRLKSNLLPSLDTGLSALLGTLELKGLLASTTVFVTGEFGRTPKVNPSAGRDHWACAMFCLLAGGAIQGGQAIGASDVRGEGPADRTITPDDVAASFYKNLGIDQTKEFHTPSGRPVMIVRHRTPIPELFG